MCWYIFDYDFYIGNESTDRSIPRKDRNVNALSNRARE